MDIKKIHTLDYDGIIGFMVSSYIQEFGERKFEKLLRKVMTSNKISGLISTARYKRIPPGSNDFLYCLNEVPYFIFASGQTQAIGALVALQRWNEEVNSEQCLLAEDGLRQRAIYIIEKSKSTFH